MNRCVTLNNIKQLHFHIGYKPYSRGIVQYVVCRVCILHTSIPAYQHISICTYAHMHICTRDWQKYTALSVYHIPRYLYRPYTGFPNICSNRLPTVEAGTVTTYRVGGGGRKPHTRWEHGDGIRIPGGRADGDGNHIPAPHTPALIYHTNCSVWLLFSTVLDYCSTENTVRWARLFPITTKSSYRTDIKNTGYLPWLH